MEDIEMIENKENLLRNIYYGYEIYNIDRATAGLKKSISAYIENASITKISDYQVVLDFFKKNMKVFLVGR
jgi:hypothetical protein